MNGREWVFTPTDNNTYRLEHGSALFDAILSGPVRIKAEHKPDGTIIARQIRAN